MSLRNRLGMILLNANEAIRELEREEVMPTDRNGPTTLDAPPPSARSQAGAFVPSEAHIAKMALIITDPSVPASEAASAAFAYARECGAMPAFDTRAVISRAEETVKQTYAYLRRLLVTCAPQCTPLPDLLGLCTQIDNMIAGLRAPASGPNVEKIANIIGCSRRAHFASEQEWVDAMARAIAALFPAPAALPPKVAKLVREAREIVSDNDDNNAAGISQYPAALEALSLVRRLAALGENASD